jgi:hypothetical protein
MPPTTPPSVAARLYKKLSQKLRSNQDRSTPRINAPKVPPIKITARTALTSSGPLGGLFVGSAVGWLPACDLVIGS